MQRTPLLSGEAGTAQTVAVMRRLVDQAQADPTFVRFVVDLVRAVPAYDDLGETRQLYEWVRQNIRYTKDPVSKEKLYPPQELLKIRAGDCDDLAMLLGAMGLTLGYPARLITISADPENPQEFSHVYLELEVPPGSGQWIPLDAARPGAQYGVEPPFYFRKKAWSLLDSSSQDLSGCQCGGRCGCGEPARGGPPGALAGYRRFPNLSQGGSVDWGQIIEQSVQEIPQMMAIGQGSSTQVSSGAGVVATGPYASFATPYTPGAGIPPAGYGSVLAAPVSVFGSLLPWLAIGALAFMLAGKGKH